MPRISIDAIRAVLFALALALPCAARLRAQDANDVLLKQARELFDDRKYEDARQSCEALLKKSATYVPGWMLLADIAGKLRDDEGEYIAAQEAWRLLDARESLSDSDRATLGELDARLDKLNPARVKFKDARAKHVAALLAFAQLEIDAKRWDTAQAALQAALDADPKNADAARLLAGIDAIASGAPAPQEPGSWFNGISLEGWIIQNGDWRAADGAIAGTQAADARQTAALQGRPAVPANFTMKFDIALQPQGALGSVAAILIETPTAARHLLRFEIGEKQIAANITPKPESADAIVFPKPAGLKILATPLPAGQFTPFTLRQQGRDFVLECRGEECLRYTLPEGDALQPLKLGLGVVSGAARFQHVIVRGSDAKEAPAESGDTERQ